jgi:signal transduction histidine kinase
MMNIPGHGELWIATERDGADDVLVRVEDSGVGLNQETAAKIFQPFFTTKPQGVGLGLAISRSIIEAHDGRLWATPRLQGGAAFQFTIPAAAWAEKRS